MYIKYEIYYNYDLKIFNFLVYVKYHTILKAIYHKFYSMYRMYR